MITSKDAVQIIKESHLFSFMLLIIDETDGLFTSVGFSPMMFETLFHLMKCLHMNPLLP